MTAADSPAALPADPQPLVNPQPPADPASSSVGPTPVRLAVRTLVGPVIDPATYRAAAYLLVALPIGVLTFSVVISALSVGISLALLVVGVVVLAWTLAACRAAAPAELRLIQLLVGVRIDAPEPVHRSGPWQRQLAGELGSAIGWKAAVWFLLRFGLGLVALFALTVPPMLAAGLVAESVGGVLNESALGYRLVGGLGGVATLLLWPHVITAVAGLHAVIARGLLGVSAGQQVAAAARRAAVAETRTDLARELHDSVGHSLTATLMQARAARRQLVDDPAAAEQALIAIEQQNRIALEELDQALAVLRDGGAERVTHTLADVPALVASCGQPVDVRWAGPLDQVASGPGRLGYRVVQEGLTNVARHAPGARAAVSVEVEPPLLRVVVRNGPARGVAVARHGRRPAGGTGLLGLTERVERLGGTLTAGPTAEGGFLVHAELPTGRG